MKITWYGHSCFKIESGDYSLVIDPFTGVPGYEPLSIKANDVYSTHGHFDHNYFDGVEIIPYSGASAPLRVDTLLSFHDETGGSQRGINNIHIFEAEGLRAVHLGDLGHVLSDSQAERLRGCDVLMIPVGGFYTIDAEKAYEIVNQLDPRIIIPMHYRLGDRGLENIAEPYPFLSKFDESFIKVYPTHEVEVTADTPEHLAFLK